MQTKNTWQHHGSQRRAVIPKAWVQETAPSVILQGSTEPRNRIEAHLTGSEAKYPSQQVWSMLLTPPSINTNRWRCLPGNLRACFFPSSLLLFLPSFLSSWSFSSSFLFFLFQDKVSLRGPAWLQTRYPLASSLYLGLLVDSIAPSFPKRSSSYLAPSSLTKERLWGLKVYNTDGIVFWETPWSRC